MLPRLSIRSLVSGWDPIVFRSLLLIFAVVLFGTAGYTWIEGWSPWKSLFFTLVTLTTVGYGDYGLSEAGERFTAVIMIGGIGTVSYTASLVLQRLMTRATQPQRRSIERIRKMQDHHIVCGLGRTGIRAIQKLLEEGAQVAAIDADADRVAQARELGIMAIVGDATSDDALGVAGIERASAVAAVTSSDAVNALICLTVHALNPELRIIARAEDESSICKLRRAGADSVISPASYGGDGVAENMLRPDVARLLPGLQGSDDGLHFAEITVTPHSVHEGKSVRELGVANPDLVFIAIRDPQGKSRLRPEGSHVLKSGEVVVVTGDALHIEGLRSNRRAA